MIDLIYLEKLRRQRSQIEAEDDAWQRRWRSSPRRRTIPVMIATLMLTLLDRLAAATLPHA